MPTENENPIDNLFDSTNNEPAVSLDVTQFNIPEGHVEVTIKVDGENRIIVVDKDYAYEDNELGWMVDETTSMSYFINNHGLCFMHTCEWKKVEDECDVVYSEYSNEWMWTDDSVYGYFNRGEEGYFHHEEDYIRCQNTETIYVDSDEAEYHGVYYCDGCDEYRSDEHHDFDDCRGDNRSESTFNNHQGSASFLTNKKLLLEHNKRWGTDSPTFTISNGMQYTFGVEMETDSGYLENDVWNTLNLSGVYDGSINGTEYVTGVLKGDYGFNHLNKICKELSIDHQLRQNCGVHVHIGGTFNRRFTIMLLRLCYHLQDDIYRMMPPSRVTNTYCKPIPTWASEVNFQNFRKLLCRYI